MQKAALDLDDPAEGPRFEEARDALMERPWQADQQAKYEAMAQQSLSDQQAIEAADSLPFEEWRQRYLSPEGLLV